MNLLSYNSLTALNNTSKEVSKSLAPNPIETFYKLDFYFIHNDSSLQTLIFRRYVTAQINMLFLLTDDSM